LFEVGASKQADRFDLSDGTSIALPVTLRLETLVRPQPIEYRVEASDGEVFEANTFFFSYAPHQPEPFDKRMLFRAIASLPRETRQDAMSIPS
tara:strand:+ start:141 stop:419 length:279 start_codon:yes stop_codon:yes gene_type:complete